MRHELNRVQQNRRLADISLRRVGLGSDPKKPLRRRPAAYRQTATAGSHVNSMRRSVSRIRQNPQEKCVLMTENSPLIGSQRRADYHRTASAADGDASDVKNAAGKRNLGLPDRRLQLENVS